MLLLPLLAFLFVSLLVAAGAMALAPGGGRDDRAPARRGHAAAASSDARRRAGYDRTVIDTLKKIGSVAPQLGVGDGQAAAAAGHRRLPRPAKR